MATSPDVSQYVDLSIFDADPADLAAQAQANHTIQFPDWIPTEGTAEVTLIEDLAVIASEMIFSINRLPGAIMATLLQLYNIFPLPGTFATATATVTFVDTQGYTIAAGTPFQIVLPSGVYNFDTVGDATAAPGSQTVSVNLISEVSASAPNGTPIGTQLQQVVQTYNIDTIVLSSAISGGTDPETNTAWLNRGANKLQSISTTLVTPGDFEAAALENPLVFRAHASDLWNPTANNGSGGQSVGWLTLSVMGEGGAPLSADQRAALQTTLDSQCIGGLNIAVLTPTVTTVNIQVNVWQKAGYTASQVQANVQTQLLLPISQGGLGMSPDQWDWSNILRYNTLVAVITQAPGVAYVTQMVTPSADVPLSGIAPLVTLGSVTVNVSGP